MRQLSIILLILLLPSLMIANTHQPELLIIYKTQQDQNQILSMVTDLDIASTTIAIDDLTVSDIGEYNMIIFASSTEFSTEDTIEQAILSYLVDPAHHFIMISPFFNEFSDDLETRLGIENINERIEEENSTLEWTITPNQSFGNFSTTDNFSYVGEVTIVDLVNEAQTIASFTSVSSDSEETNELELPQPAIWNISNQIHTVATSLNSTSAGLSLDQTNDFISTLLKEVVVNAVLTQLDKFGTDTGETGTDTDNTRTEGILDLLPELDPTLQFSIGALILSIFALLYSKIIRAIQWIIRKTYGVIFAVVGVFYNVQDRTLSHNEVMMNVSRAEIMSFLQHVGAYGAHLREIKSITNMGSGSLL